MTNYVRNATCHIIDHILNSSGLTAKREAVDARSWDRDGTEAAAIMSVPGLGSADDISAVSAWLGSTSSVMIEANGIVTSCL